MNKDKIYGLLNLIENTIRFNKHNDYAILEAVYKIRQELDKE